MVPLLIGVTENSYLPNTIYNINNNNNNHNNNKTNTKNDNKAQQFVFKPNNMWKVKLVKRKSSRGNMTLI